MELPTNIIIYIIIILIIITILIYIYSTREKFEQENTQELDNIPILEECKDITAEKMFKLFNEDLDYLTRVFVDNNIPLRAIKDLSYYPKIASLLVKKGILKCA